MNTENSKTHPGHSQKISRSIQLAMGIYELLWRLCIPLLKHHPRLRQGFAARSAADHLPAADIWLHAASAGEAYLALTLVNNLPTEARLRVLITTNTRQGLDIIKTGATAEKIPPGIAIHSIYIPFDRPRLAQQAVQRVFPKVMILLETELWPGLLLALKKHNIPVLLLNGRITAKSLKSYLLWPGLWKCLGPDHVLAISQEDAGRFGRLFGHKNVHTMKNIKFDQLNTQAHPATDHLKTILPQDRPFLVLGSVRQEEEKSVEAIITRIHSALPEILIGLFPRHMERMDYWTQTLNQLDINWIRRSDLNQGTAPDATVILWDVFGELQPAYALARAVFVGGSLAPLGGQNFLEPMIYGISPVIGPSWENFAWAGREIFQQGLAISASDWQTVAAELIRQLQQPAAMQGQQAAAVKYLEAQKGGAARAVRLITDILKTPHSSGEISYDITA